MLEIKLNVVNKREYEENHNFREIVIRLPKPIQELKEDFKYLGLDYNNISIQDTHVLECEVIDKEDPMFSVAISSELNNIIVRASESGYTSPFQEIKKVYEMFSKMEDLERDKSFAILKLKKEQICNLQDTIKYLKNINSFEYYPDTETPTDYARIQVRNGEFEVSDVIDYIDLKTLGEDTLSDEEHKFTDVGLIIQENYNIREYEEEEEFE